jgi:hypothetical protein
MVAGGIVINAEIPRIMSVGSSSIRSSNICICNAYH